MKKVLITGLQGYIGKHLIERLNNFPEQYNVETISLKTEDWKQKSLSGYDVIVHLAALVHNSQLSAYDFEKVNINLTEELAVKAKSEGVNHFIFLSTMGVYSQKNDYIDLHTPTDPETHYAISKKKAERKLQRLADHQFKLSILRPPFVYGKQAPGNYQAFSKLAQKSPLFPEFQNMRSMIYIDNLTEFIRLVIDNEITGILFPQNSEYVNTYELFKEISSQHQKKFLKVSGTQTVLKLLSGKVNTFKKVFGNFVYDNSLPGGPEDFKQKGLNYNMVNFNESVKRSEEF